MCNETFTKFLCKTISLCLATFIYLSLEMIMKLVETQFAFLLQGRRERGGGGGGARGVPARDCYILDCSLMVSTHTIPTIALSCIFIGSFNKYVIWKGRRENEESNRKLYRIKEGVQSKKWYPLHKLLYLLFSVTQSFLLGF